MNQNTTSAPRVTEADLKAEVVDRQFYVFPGTNHTIALLMLANGHTIIGESACVSAENFDAAFGRELAEKDALEKLWPLLGFRLRDKLHALAKGVSQVDVIAPPAKVVGKAGAVLLAAARAAHEANRVYCESLGDRSQPVWDAAPDWQRDSAIEGVKALLANPHLTPADLHARWLEHKRADAWAYGPTKDAAAKLHPCMVPYDELPEAQRVKDALFRVTVLNAAAAAGWTPPNMSAEVERPVPVEAVGAIPEATSTAALAAATDRPGRADEYQQERRRRHETIPNDARPDTNALVGSTQIDHTNKRED